MVYFKVDRIQSKDEGEEEDQNKEGNVIQKPLSCDGLGDVIFQAAAKVFFRELFGRKL